MWRKLLLLALVLAVGGGILISRWISRPPKSREPAALAVLDHQCRSLTSLLEVARERPLVAAKPILFVIDESVVRDLVEATLPFEQVVAKRFLIRVDSVAVQFVDGFSWIRLDCRASLVDHDVRDLSAQLSVYGGLEIVGVDPATGALLGRVTVFSVDTRAVALLQMDAPLERLIDDLSKVELAKFGVLLSHVQVPVQLDREITLPAIGPKGGVRVKALTLPLTASIEDVKAFSGRLWIAVSAKTDTVLPAPPAPEKTVRPHTPQTAKPAARRGVTSLIARSRSQIRHFKFSLHKPALLRDAGHSRLGEMPAQLALLTQRRAALHDSLEAAIGDDPLIRAAIADSGNVLIAVQSRFVTDVMRRVLDEYFDRVELSFTMQKDIHRDGELHVQTPLGKANVGRWTVDLTVQSISGTLRTRNPRLAVTRANHIDVAVPVHLEQGRGSGALIFDWDSRSLVSALCRDFMVSEELSAQVLPGDYEVHGGFHIVARGRRLVAEPQFPPEKYRIRVDLNPASWRRVREALETQTPTSRCGTVLRPEAVLERLREIGADGFSVKLPRSLFRPVELPVVISQTVRVEDKQVEVAVAPLALRVTPGLFWYSARASATRAPAAAVRHASGRP